MQKYRWLVAALNTADDESLTLPWSRTAGRKQRKAAARARALAG